MKDATCNLLIDYLNNQLNDEKRKKFEEHMSICKDCYEEYNHFVALSEDLPFTVEAVEPPSGMKKRILSNVLSEEKESPVISMWTNKKQWVKPLLTASLLISLLGNAYAILTRNAEGDKVPPQRISAINTFEKAVNLQPSGVMASKATALLINKNNEIDLVVHASELQKTEGNQVYQVWLLENRKPYRAGTFVPNQKGEGAVAYNIRDLGNHKWDTIAITLEPNEHSQTPKGKILLSSAL